MSCLHKFANVRVKAYSAKFYKLLFAAVVAGGFACMASAAMLDLAGVDRTVTDVSELDGYDGVTNTSETQATLTFNLPNSVVQTYNGVIAGNIKLVKQGGKSKLELTRTNTYTGGTQIDGGVIIVSNPMACGDPTKSVVISSFSTSANKIDGPWCALQFAVSGFSNPISLPEGTASSAWAGNTYCNHSLCVTNNNISIYSPISGGYFAFLAATNFIANGTGELVIKTVNFYGPITCTGMKIYSGGDVHFRGAITNSLQNVEGAAYVFTPRFYFYSSENSFNGTALRSTRGYFYVKADNALKGLDFFAGGKGSADCRLLLQGHEVTIGRTLCVSETAGATGDNQTVTGDAVGSVLRMQGSKNTISNVRFKNSMSLIWDPTGDYEFVATSNRTSNLGGPLVVKRGTFTLDGGHTMPNVTNIEVVANATFKVMSGSSFSSAAVMRTEPGATIDLAADATVKTLSVGGRYLPSGDYAPGTYEGLTIAGATLHVTSEPYFKDWKTSMGEYYPYPYPVYVADVDSGTSSIEDMTFKKIEGPGGSITTDVSYAEFTASAATGTIVKRGVGTLSFDKDISSFTGPVHIEEGVAIGTCSNCFGRTVKVAPPYAHQRTYVHSGATLVMDAVNNKPAPAESNAVYYEGDGFPGMGGAFVTRNGENASDSYSRWQLGVGARATGPARLYLDVPDGGKVGVTYDGANGQKASDFSANGQELLIYGRTVGSQFYINAAGLNGFGNLFASNVTITVAGNSGRIIPKNDTSSTIHFCGGSRWLWYTYDNNQSAQNNQTATAVIDDMEYASFGSGTNDGSNYGVHPYGDTDGTTNNWWRGPVVLNDDFRMYNSCSPRNSSTKRRYGCTFSREVRGPKGFRSWFNSNGVCWGDGMRINLLYPVNTFEGGIVLDGGSLGVWAERAVPSHEGAGLVSITNGYVYFGRKGRAPSATKWPEFIMPVTELVGNCAVTNGTGVWKGLVKKGAGTLDYNSQLGGDYLDLQEGTVKFKTQYREEYAGENAPYVPNGYVAALPAFTTLKGTEGVLDLADVGGAYTVANIEGSPSVTNGNLTVTGTWAVGAATVGVKVANVSGTLAFGEGATMVVAGDLESVSRPADGFVVARATSIAGMPSFNLVGWKLQQSGGELRLVKPGLIIFIR